MWYASHRILWPLQGFHELVQSSAKYVLAGFLYKGCQADPVCLYLLVILASNIHANSWTACVLWTVLAWHAALGFPSNWWLRACLLAFSGSVPLFGKKAGMAAPELRISKSGEKASVRWRIQSAAAVSEHKAVFLGYGMQGDGKKGHSLETVGMTLVAAKDMIRSLQLIHATADSFIDRYIACYAVMQPHMTEVVGETFPKLTLDQHPTDSLLARPQWKSRSGKKLEDTLSGVWTHKAPLQSMVDEVNSRLAALATLEACQSYVNDFCCTASVNRSERPASRGRQIQREPRS